MDILELIDESLAENEIKAEDEDPTAGFLYEAFSDHSAGYEVNR
jgi:hypothetical protein